MSKIFIRSFILFMVLIGSSGFIEPAIKRCLPLLVEKVHFVHFPKKQDLDKSFQNLGIDDFVKSTNFTDIVNEHLNPSQVFQRLHEKICDFCSKEHNHNVIHQKMNTLFSKTPFILHILLKNDPVAQKKMKVEGFKEESFVQFPEKKILDKIFAKYLLIYFMTEKEFKDIVTSKDITLIALMMKFYHISYRYTNQTVLDQNIIIPKKLLNDLNRRNKLIISELIQNDPKSQEIFKSLSDFNEEFYKCFHVPFC